MNIAMIFAGGRGVRMGSGIPKQFLEIHGKAGTCAYIGALSGA